MVFGTFLLQPLTAHWGHGCYLHSGLVIMVIHFILQHQYCFTVYLVGYFYYDYYNRFTVPWTVSRTTRVNWYQKDKTNLDLLEQEIVSGSGISWAYANLHLAPDR